MYPQGTLFNLQHSPLSSINWQPMMEWVHEQIECGGYIDCKLLSKKGGVGVATILNKNWLGVIYQHFAGDSNPLEWEVDPNFPKRHRGETVMRLRPK